MKIFVNSILKELTNDPQLNENSLVKLAIKSANSSIKSNDTYDSICNQLKESLIGINEHLKNEKIKLIIDQFTKKEQTIDSVLYEMSKVGNLTGKLNAIKESKAYSNPIIKTKVDNFASAISNGTPEFKLYPSFINDFNSHLHESSIKTVVDQVINVLENKLPDFEVLNTIHTMTGMKSPIYESTIVGLKKMLAENKYSADIINLKYGETNLPLISNLVNNLRIAEARSNGEFTLGQGNSDTIIKNLIAPAKKTDNGIIAYFDNKFVRISEATKADGNESEIHINDKFTIATINPNYVKESHEDFYNLAEAFASLGFKDSELREGVETKSVRNFKIGLATNEAKTLDIYLNDNKVDGLDSINLTEALVMETPSVRNRVEYIFENLSSIFTFEFIKNVSNDRMASEATVFELSGSYFICEKLDAANRKWSNVDEHQLYEFFATKFQYDISPIFKTEISEILEKKKQIETAKASILENVNKLEASVGKLNTTIKSGDVNSDEVAKLERLKESIESSISKLKEEYISIDLAKKEVIKEGKLNPGLQAYLDKKKGKTEDKKDNKDDSKKEDKKAKKEAKEKV